MTARPPLQRILLVEDDPDIQTVAGLALTRIGGFTVEICGTAREAFGRAPAFRPDLIILDVMMPGMDGVSALKALREIPETMTTPVVFMTARAQAQDLALYKEMGSLGVIAKPFEPMTLADTLRGLWNPHGE